MWRKHRARLALGIAVGMLTLGVPLALQGASALAATGKPTITSVTPREGGSGGGYKVTFKGTHYEEISSIKWGIVPMKIITTGTPTKGQCKVKSTIEIECQAPTIGWGTITLAITNPLGSAEQPYTLTAQVFRNEVVTGSGANVTVFGMGVLTFETPEVELEPGVKSREVEIECVNLLFGSVYNEGTEPPRAKGQIFEWWAMGHTPTSEHNETSPLCRFTYLGGPGGEAWVTAERPLNVVEQEGEVCLLKTKHELSQCPKKVGEPGAERVITSVIREVTREPLTNPWNTQVVSNLHEGARENRLRIGVPTESGKSCEEIPAPPGCVRLTIIYPAINLQFPFEGYMEPVWENGVGNGLSPSTLEYKGESTGRLHVAGSLEAPLYAAGYDKILGAAGRELLTVK